MYTGAIMSENPRETSEKITVVLRNKVLKLVLPDWFCLKKNALEQIFKL